MQTIILIVSFLLTGLLATWSVIKGERDKKAKKLFPKLLFDLGQKTQDEIRTMISSELKKEKKDKVLIIALQKVLDHRNGLSELTIKEKVKSFGKFIGAIFLILFLMIKWSILALLPTLFIGLGIYLLSLIITIIQFNIIFMVVVFGIFFIIFAVKEFDK